VLQQSGLRFVRTMRKLNRTSDLLGVSPYNAVLITGESSNELRKRV
jgi:hypothetical protein